MALSKNQYYIIKNSDPKNSDRRVTITVNAVLIKNDSMSTIPYIINSHSIVNYYFINKPLTFSLLFHQGCANTRAFRLF